VHAAYVADALHDAGCDVTLYALDKDGRGFFRELRAPLRLVPASPTPRSVAELVRIRAREISAYLERLGAPHDVLHAEDCLTANGLLEGISRGTSALVCRTVHHVEKFEDPSLARCQERSILEPALCLAVSEAAEQDVLRSFGVRASRVSNGVSVQRFADVDPQRTRALGQRLATGPGPVLLGVGGVEERKNTLRILRAFAIVRARHPGARLLLCGGATVLDHGAYRAAFERELGALPPGTASAVTELGVIGDDEVPPLFRLANVLVFPSLHEGFGLAALEALASGLPVVSSRRAPLTEFLDDSCAFLVDPLSDEDIARGIHQALSCSPDRRRAGRARAEAYSWSRAAAIHLEHYERLVRSHRRGLDSAVVGGCEAKPRLEQGVGSHA
jgi:glycosyltransferase-like protein